MIDDIMAQMSINPENMFKLETYAQYTTSVIVFIITFTVLKVAKSISTSTLRKVADKTENKLDDTAVDILDGLGTMFYFSISLYVASMMLSLPLLVSNLIYYLLIATIVYYAVRFIQKLMDYTTGVVIDIRKKEGGKDEDVSLIELANKILKIAIWVLGGFVFLENIGVDITPLLAGVSIGGIAIAFALQNMLGDMFASFSIYFDRPFKKGDYIVVGADDGTVKSIGIKSTRIQTLRGEELIISNKELTNSRVHNFKMMKNRRVDFEIGVTYNTDPKKLEKIPKIVAKVIDELEGANFGRCHLNKFADSSLLYKIMYHVKSQDYDKYMDTHQAICLGITKAFAKEKIEFAFPTQTIHLQK
jgi:small-conductance mechanosensitive channel